FDYATGEAVELGRALRLPNASLRRKLELEQPEGCAWHGCDRPVAWTEAHHIEHWADGGPTSAENLILLCRFHHGRIHTAGWSVEKTGPGQAVITHHDGHGSQGGDDSEGCGCSDWRTDRDMDAENEGTEWDVFPTGLYRSEWSETMKHDLDALAQAIDRDRAIAAMRAAKAKCRARFAAPGQARQAEAAPDQTTPAPIDYGPPPFLTCPSRQTAGGSAATPSSAARPAWVRAPRHAQSRKPSPPHTLPSLPA
ncbi:HNH endonuclease signature motif containing protein, partial [Glycomyces niveus]